MKQRHKAICTKCRKDWYVSKYTKIEGYVCPACSGRRERKPDRPTIPIKIKEAR